MPHSSVNTLPEEVYCLLSVHPSATVAVGVAAEDVEVLEALIVLVEDAVLLASVAVLVEDVELLEPVAVLVAVLEPFV